MNTNFLARFQRDTEFITPSGASYISSLSVADLVALHDYYLKLWQEEEGVNADSYYQSIWEAADAEIELRMVRAGFIPQ